MKEDIQLENKPKKRCQISLVIWQMQIKTRVRYQCIPTGRAFEKY